MELDTTLRCLSYTTFLTTLNSKEDSIVNMRVLLQHSCLSIACNATRGLKLLKEVKACEVMSDTHELYDKETVALLMDTLYEDGLILQTSCPPVRRHCENV
jgi:hypothetical protein